MSWAGTTQQARYRPHRLDDHFWREGGCSSPVCWRRFALRMSAAQIKYEERFCRRPAAGLGGTGIRCAAQAQTLAHRGIIISTPKEVSRIVKREALQAPANQQSTHQAPHATHSREAQTQWQHHHHPRAWPHQPAQLLIIQSLTGCPHPTTPSPAHRRQGGARPFPPGVRKSAYSVSVALNQGNQQTNGSRCAAAPSCCGSSLGPGRPRNAAADGTSAGCLMNSRADVSGCARRADAVVVGSA